METNRFILVLIISLSCLFSLSASTRDAPASAPSSSSDVEASSAPSPASSEAGAEAEAEASISLPPSSSELEVSSSSAPSPSPSSSSSSSSSLSIQASVSFAIPESEKTQTFNIMPTNVDPGLQKICGDTDHPIECVTTTAPLLQQVNVVIEPVSILKIEIEAMNAKAKEALALANQHLKDPSNSEKMNSCLEQCIDGYEAVIETNQKALEAIAVRDLYELSLELSSNVENANDCADSFKEARVTSPIEEIDTLLGKMISNSLAIGVDMVRF